MPTANLAERLATEPPPKEEQPLIITMLVIIIKFFIRDFFLLKDCAFE